MTRSQPIQGAFPDEQGTTFRVWAPRVETLSVAIEGGPTRRMRRDVGGWFEVSLDRVRPGARYAYVLSDGRRRADPASRLQEGSVHGDSTVCDLAYPWTDAGWRGVPLSSLITYEVHVGTFTPQGTLDAILPRLEALARLGVTAIELMPVAAFDGARGWGYDGVLSYSVHAAYGGPRALQRLVDACHRAGLAVILDVVYNHLGPAGNYLRDFGPYFTDRHQTPWGEAINYDGADAGPVRAYFIENALHWVRDFHVDGLRLDAVHGIVDASPRHLLEELEDRVEQLARQAGREVHLIAESDLNEPRLVHRRDDGGYGLAAQWSDDFHHALHALLTGERDGYYADFGRLEDLASAYRQAFVFTGQYSRFRGRPHGRPASGLLGRRFVVAAQNHDQVGNRALGERLGALVPPEALRLAAAATVLSPFLPLLFMGEEYAEPAPFQYFTSFPDEALGRAVSEGRRGEFASFGWPGEVPDPQAPETFAASRLDWSLAEREPHAAMRRFYRRALELRRTVAALGNDGLGDQLVEIRGRALLVRRPAAGGSEPDALLVLHFADGPARTALPAGRWRLALDAWAPEFAGDNTHALAGGTISGELMLGPWHAALLLLER